MALLDFKHFKGDLMGGITAGIVALPLALAFGVQSGLGPDAGLYGAIFIAFFAALFGGTDTQVSGPTAPMTALSMLIIAGIIATNDGNVAQALPYILLVFMLSGVFEIIWGVIGLGKYIKYIPYPVVSGFMTAIGLMILITQILPFVGYQSDQDETHVQSYYAQAKESLYQKAINKKQKDATLNITHLESAVQEGKGLTQSQIHEEASSLAKSADKGVIGSIKALPRVLRNINWIEVMLCLLTIGIIYGFKRITKKIPSTLVALIVVSVFAVIATQMQWFAYLPIQEIPKGFPKFRGGEILINFSFAQISPYVLTALMLSLLGAIDSLLTSVVADNMTKTRHNPNKELIGQGIGNSIAAMFGGLPGAGATIRTVVNINAGGKTRLSGMIAGVLLLIVLLFIGPIASKIPVAVLAGILITVGIGVMDYKGLKAIPAMPKDSKIGPIEFSSDVAVMLLVMGLATFWNLIYAVIIGLLLASFLFMKKIGNLNARRSDVKPLSFERAPTMNDPSFPQQLVEEVFVKRVRGPLFFGYTSDFQSLSEEIPSSASHVIIRMGEVNYMDQSGLYAMEEVLMNLYQNNIIPMFENLKRQPRVMMTHIDIIPDMVSEDLIFDNFEAAKDYISKNVKDVTSS